MYHINTAYHMYHLNNLVIVKFSLLSFEIIQNIIDNIKFTLEQATKSQKGCTNAVLILL